MNRRRFLKTGIALMVGVSVGVQRAFAVGSGKPRSTVAAYPVKEDSLCIPAPMRTPAPYQVTKEKRITKLTNMIRIEKWNS